MSNWKIALAVGALVAISILVGAIAYASIISTARPTYSNTAPGAYAGYPSTGNIPYPTTPSYPAQPYAPVYPTQPPSVYIPGYGSPYGGYGEREMGPWGGE